MSISALAREDIAAIHAADCENAELTAPPSLGSGVYMVPCQFIRRGATRDADGMAIIGDSAIASISLGALSSLGLTEPEDLKVKGWTATINGNGYRLDACMLDYTIGVATVILKRSAS